ncbi:MAG TPA: MFS transporter [Candidatus Dormibacteraeota bacterium]
MAVGRLAFWIVGATFGLFLFAAAAPSPLYAVYAAQWHFSPVSLTEVFAVYAVALLVALLSTGHLSDAVGRRPVILVALVIQIASMAVFVGATGLGWLFAARILQGVATGVATSAMAAALVDLQPAERPGLAPLVNSVAPIGGLAAGALVSAALVQYGPAPLHLVYWLLTAAFGLGAVMVVLLPEPSKSRQTFRLAPSIGVEDAARRAFTATLPSLIAGWAVGGFYLSLGPSLALQLASSHNRLLGGFAIALPPGVGAIVTLILNRWPPRRALTFGGSALIAGLALAVLAIALSSGGGFLVASAVTGVGFGLAWLGVLRTLVGLASPGGRGALLAAIYIVAYLAFAIPAVIAGYLVTRIGLHDASLWYAAAVGLLALAGLAGSLLVRIPGPMVAAAPARG